MVKQVSVFVENTPGSLKEVIAAISNNNININALSVADTSKFGIARMILSDEELAEKVLKEEGFIVRIRDIVAVAVNDEPGALMKALEILKDNNIAIEYMYAFGEKIDGMSVLAIRTDDNDTAEKSLKDSGVKVL